MRAWEKTLIEKVAEGVTEIIGADVEMRCDELGKPKKETYDIIRTLTKDAMSDEKFMGKVVEVLLSGESTDYIESELEELSFEWVKRKL